MILLLKLVAEKSATTFGDAPAFNSPKSSATTVMTVHARVHAIVFRHGFAGIFLYAPNLGETTLYCNVVSH